MACAGRLSAQSLSFPVGGMVATAVGADAGSAGTAATVHDPASPPEAATQPDRARTWTDWRRMTGEWGTARSRLEALGIRVSGWSVSDLSGTGGRGIPSAAAARGLFDIDVSFDLQKLARIPGGAAYVQYFGNVGMNGSAQLGVYQSFSNIDSAPFRRIGELWFEQSLAGGRVRVKAGRVDANSEFARTENGSEFINAALGYSPTIGPLPTYPSPAWSANLFAYPTQHFYVGAGGYLHRRSDGDADGDDDEARRPFLIAEMGATWALRGGSLHGRAGLGAWYEAAVSRARDAGRPRMAPAPFFVLDQDLWRRRRGGGESGGFFLLYGHAAPTQAEVVRHVGLGVRWNAPLPGRKHDVAGVGFTAIRFSPLSIDRTGGEIAFGPFYKWQATGWLSVKPDIQVVRNAGGMHPRSYAVAVTLRLRLEM